VDPIPDPLLFRKSGSARNRTQTSGSVARNSHHYNTEVDMTHNRSLFVMMSKPLLLYHENIQPDKGTVFFKEKLNKKGLILNSKLSFIPGNDKTSLLQNSNLTVHTGKME
jgi:hypothetical protein